MKIDRTTKEIKISIRELSLFSQNKTSDQEGSIGLSSRIRASIGRDAHTNYQDDIQMSIPGVKCEYQVKYTAIVDGWKVHVNGRADVVYEKNGTTTVEEIKSVTSQFNSKYTPSESHTRQLQLYSQHFIKKNKNVKSNLVIYEVLTGKYHKIKVPVEDQSSYISSQINLMIEYYIQTRKKKKQMSTRIGSIKFPFDRYRTHQEELIDLTLETLANNKSLIVRAPSGLGKTVGTLYPTMKYAIKNSLRIFVATSKTTQQKMYRDTLKIIASKNGNFSSIILTAKEKICNNTEFVCDPSSCTYLDNYLKLDLSKSIVKLLTKTVLTSRNITREANSKAVCAFELSLDVALGCDVIVGDYNYIFHPQVRLRRFFDRNYKDSIVIIDEAHNLPQRAVEYYSPTVQLNEISACKVYLRSSKISGKIISQGTEIFDRLYQFIEVFEKMIPIADKWQIRQVTIDEQQMLGFQKEIDLLVLKYIEEYTNLNQAIPKPNDLVLQFAEKINYFNSILKDSSDPAFSQIYDKDLGSLEIFCKSAVKKLSKQMKGFHSAIAQSATLFPMEYHKKVLGFPKSSVIAEYGSPFPKENQLHICHPYISTTYHNRRNYDEDIAKLIVNSTKHKSGNYLAFFPSFGYLRAVYRKIAKLDLPFRILIQEPSMSERKRRKLLKRLTANDNNYLLLAVQGGIFSEGVDFIGDMAIGVFIVGPGLPAYSFKQELRKKYFGDTENKGFEYAYRNPGMTKIIQAAGRIYRTEIDKGFVLLIGSRFETPFYAQVLPNDWEIISSKSPGILIEQFWNTQASGELTDPRKIPSVGRLEDLLEMY